MTDMTGAELRRLFAVVAETQRESDRLLGVAQRRAAYESAVARHAELKATGTNLGEFQQAREELAAYGDDAPPPVSSEELLAYHRRRVEALRALSTVGGLISAAELDQAEAELAAAEQAAAPHIELISFGYLHGDAPEAELVVDMRRHFRDPHVTPELRELTADHELVMRTVLNTDGVRELADAIIAAITAYRSGPSGDVIRVAVGCAGGRHRSAAMVNYLYGRLAFSVLRVAVSHRDIDRPVVER